MNDLLHTGWDGPDEKLPDFLLTFALYALNNQLNIPDEKVTASMLESAMEGHILGKAIVTCTYS